jgi:peroxiredoxin
MLVALRDNLRAQGMEVVFVSVDEPDAHGAAVEFATTNGLAPPILVAERPLGPFKQALNPKWPGMLPATFLFDETGKLRYFWGGPVYEQELLPIVEGFLAGKSIDGSANFGLVPGKDFRHE